MSGDAVKVLDAEMTQALKGYLERLQRPIVLTPSVDGSEAGQEIEALLAQIAALSDKVRVTAAEPAPAGAHVPSFSIAAEGQAPRIRFAALPLGHEFTSLVLALLHTGGHPPRIEDAVADQVRALPGPLAFEVVMSLSCQSCPDVVQALNTMAALNPNVRVESLDGAMFQEEVARREVMAVPTVFLNGQPFGQGRMSLEEILAKVDTGAAERDAKALSQRAPYDMLIVGGGPAGAAAAVYAARKGIRTGIVAERLGGQVLDTLSIENYPSVEYTEGPQFAAALEAQVRKHEVDVMTGQRAAGLKAAVQPGGLAQLTLANGAVLKARTVLLATGARWRELNVPGEAEHRNKGVAYCPHCDGPLFKGKRVAVVGGGNSGVEAAIDLAGIVEHVTVVEFLPQMKADQVLIDKLHSLPNVDVRLNTQTTQVIGEGGRVAAMVLKDRATGAEAPLKLAGVFVQIGLQPNTEWLKDSGLALSRYGEIEVDARGATNLPGIYAAGDATTVPFKQIVVAAGEGAKASLGAFDHLIRTPALVEATAATARPAETVAA